MKPAEYHNVGQYLRECRESLSLSAAQAGQALHIRPRYIEAIEAGKLDALPGKAYVKGYIKNYAAYLGLDGDETLTAYDGLPAAAPQAYFLPEPTSHQNMPSMLLLALSLAAVLMFYSYWNLSGLHPRAPDLTVPEVPRSLLLGLDNSPFRMMDKPWRECLLSDDAACFIQILSHKNIAPSSVIYDIVFPPDPPKMP